MEPRVLALSPAWAAEAARERRRRAGPRACGRLPASRRQGAASPTAEVARVPGSAPFGRLGDLGRRAASAGHGCLEPGRGSASAPREPRGGCGAMYEIQIESEEFKEKRTVQQHQMVNQALKEEIKGMHGLRIFTSVPKH
uniref:BolA family member 3 n=1 Tax=Sus scrofa TaxID=9823 RepID=A0A4X1W7M0_PIG